MDKPQELYQEAQKLHEQGDSEDAIKLYRQVILDYPTSPQAVYSKNQLGVLNENPPEIKTQRSDRIAASPTTGSTSGAIGTLRFFGWLELFAGVAGGILVLYAFGMTEGQYSSGDVVNGMAIGIGIAIMLQAAFIWAFIIVFADMAENLIQIKRNTSS